MNAAEGRHVKTPGTVVAQVAELLDTAQQSATPVGTATPWPQLDLDEAYASQAALIARRLARGERGVGLKLGFTSEAKMRQMGVDELIVGQLTDGMQAADGAAIDLSALIHPRVEPEVAFLVGADVDLADPDVDLEAAITGVAPGLEIIDSRYDGFQFDLPRVVADNTSAAKFVIGPWHAPDEVDLDDVPVILRAGDEVLAEGTTAAILGHPLRTLPRLVALGRRLGLQLPAGSVVLAGAATEAVPLRPGPVNAEVAGLGTVRAVGVQGSAGPLGEGGGR
ncbi:2-keto-4-pentenoate hydratase [Nocardioides sp. NPDC057577]|uniref:2-keto-4-pentenoate hydratase n=1 Tax=Nocardioides sp. NPDC057577 TaxID=3346171 RepID=UPI003672BCD0